MMLTRRFFGLVLATVMTAGCNGYVDGERTADGGVEEQGAVQVLIASVPANVGCVVITDVAARTTTTAFTVTPGGSARLQMSNLPAGANVFSALAYARACPVAPSAAPTWATVSGTTATIQPGLITNLSLLLELVGGANIGLQFVDGGVDGG